MKRAKGFTLSEILLVLSVIGVVAALTIPTLTQKISDGQSKTAWKKAFSTLSQVTVTLMSNNGGKLMTPFMAGAATPANSNAFMTALADNLNTLKRCNNGASFGNCWHTSWKYGDGATDTDGNYTGAILADGTFLLIWVNASCNWIVAPITDGCGWIKVDVNGFKPPNIDGKDIFAVLLTDNGIKPFGGDITGWNTAQGFGKSADMLYQ